MSGSTGRLQPGIQPKGVFESGDRPRIGLRRPATGSNVFCVIIGVVRTWFELLLRWSPCGLSRFRRLGDGQVSGLMHSSYWMVFDAPGTQSRWRRSRPAGRYQETNSPGTQAAPSVLVVCAVGAEYSDLQRHQLSRAVGHAQTNEMGGEAVSSRVCMARVDVACSHGGDTHISRA
jgi:hypothetical protein